jgi:hypothetical protein
MAYFPRLRTNAVTQYPSGTSSSYKTDILRFMDGTEQRFPQWGQVRRSWTIRLELLDEVEVHGIRKFFEAQSGSFESFTFVDPWTGNEFDGCVFEGDALEVDFRSVNRAGMTIRITQGGA